MLRHFSASGAARWLLPAVAVIVTSCFLLPIGHTLLPFEPGWSLAKYRVDLDVFRTAAATWLDGGPLYEPIPTEVGLPLPYLYPPIAAVLMTPLTWVPLPVASALVTVVNIALLALVLWLFQRALGMRTGSGLRWTIGVLPIAVLLEPVRETLNFGQVNLLLMALVTVDCLARRPRWPRGLLVGLGAALKLTPAVFVLFFLLRKDFRAAVVSALAFAAAAAAGFLLAPRDSIRFWTDALFHTSDRISPVYTGNQSLLAVVSRLDLPPGIKSVVWLLLSTVVLVLIVVGMRRALALSRITWALALNSFAGLLLAPISWSQHWVWGIPLVLALAVVGHRSGARLPVVLATVGFGLFTIAPHWLMPSTGDQELRWSAWQHVIGDSYVLFGMVVLVAAAFGQAMWRDRRAGFPAAAEPGFGLLTTGSK